MIKVLVLGGFGFLGRNIEQEFSKDSKYKLFLESRRTGCNLLDAESITSKIKSLDPDIIINAAAHVGSIHYVNSNSADVCHDNVMMYLNLYKSIKEVNSNIILINPISNCSYPGNLNHQTEDEWWNGQIHPSVESYGSPKKIGYALSNCYAKQYNIKTLNLIIPNAYGPFDYVDEQRTHALNGIVLRMIKSQKAKQTTFTVWGTGTPIREWVYMPDVARIIKKIIDERKYDLPNPINIAQNYGVNINTTVDSIKSQLNYDVQISYDLSKQDGASIKILGDDKFRKYFSDFKFTPYNEGLKNTIQYYKKVLI